MKPSNLQRSHVPTFRAPHGSLPALVCFLLSAFAISALHSDVPSLLNYQGRVAVNGTNFNGTGLYKFALVNSNGTASFWSNDGTSSAGSEPIAAVSLPTSNGLYSVLLGNTALPNMTAVPASVFTNGDVRLRVWFNSGAGSQLLTPDQRIASVGYAMMAGTAADSATLQGQSASSFLSITGGVVSGAVSFTNSGNNFAGNGAALTNLNASALATGTLAPDRIADGSLPGAKLAATNTWFSSRILSSPTNLSYFGFCLSPLSPQEFVVGAPGPGAPITNAVLVFGQDGSWHRSVRIVGSIEGNGWSIASLTTNAIVFGSPLTDYSGPPIGLNAGLASYAVGTNAPSNVAFGFNPAENVGYSVCAVGTNRYLIGAPGFTNSGSSVLRLGRVTLGTVGGSSITITNPVANATNAQFGSALAAPSTNLLLIGTPGANVSDLPTVASLGDTNGYVHVFSTNASLLLTITNPAPASGHLFGARLLALPDGRYLVSAPLDGTGPVKGGAVHLFSSNHVLTTTFTCPSPATNAFFGAALALVDTQRVVITSLGNMAAYIFELNGTLDSVINNPNPSANDRFGCSAVALGSNNIYIGASRADFTGTDAGAVWRFQPTTYVPGLIAESVGLGAIGSDQLAVGAVQTTNIAAGAIGFAQLAIGAVQATNIAVGAIGSAQLAVGAVQSTNIALGAITPDKLAHPPQSGSLTSSFLELYFSEAQFSVPFSPAFDSIPVVTLTGETADTSQIRSLFMSVAFRSISNFVGFVQIARQSPVLVDSNQTTGAYTSLQTVGSLPAIAYQDSMSNDLHYVRATAGDGSLWGTPVLVDTTGVTGLYASLQVVNGNPAIAYYDDSTDDLRYVRATNSTGSGWGTPVTVDAGGLVGKYASLLVVNGNPAIAYLDETSGNLKYVRAVDPLGTNWTAAPVIVDTNGNAGHYASLRMVNGSPAIAYHETDSDDLKFVRATQSNGTTWGTPVVVESNGLAGLYCSLEMVNGSPAIAFHESSAADLLYVRATHTNGAAWDTPLLVDSDGNAGLYASLKVVSTKPAIAYRDGTRTALKFVRASDIDGVNWGVPIQVTTGENAGTHTSLQVINGAPAAAYQETTVGDLKFIRSNAFSGFTLNWMALEP